MRPASFRLCGTHVCHACASCMPAACRWGHQPRAWRTSCDGAQKLFPCLVLSVGLDVRMMPCMDPMHVQWASGVGAVRGGHGLSAVDASGGALVLQRERQAAAGVHFTHARTQAASSRSGQVCPRYLAGLSDGPSNCQVFSVRSLLQRHGGGRGRPVVGRTATRVGAEAVARLLRTQPVND